MKSQLKGYLKNILAKAGIQIMNISSDKKDVLSFLQKIYPYMTEHPLTRIGGLGDGSYLLPDDLDQIKYCFSPGVSTTINLEVELAARGIRCFMADNSVDGLPIEHPLFDFEKKHLGLVNNKDFMTLESWVGQKIGQDTDDLLLQMDIEGAEYEVLTATSDSLLQRFRIMVIEFHMMDMLFNKIAFQTIDKLFTKILASFYVVHIHPNNHTSVVSNQGVDIPPLVEFTFLRKDRATKHSYTDQFPHPLDIKNVSGRADIVLPGSWYRKDTF